MRKQDLFGIYFQGQRLNSEDGFFGSRERAEQNLVSHADHWNKLAEMRKTKTAKAGGRCTMAGFVIEMTHRKTGERRYICAVPVMRDDCEYENTPVDTLDEARHHPYSEAEVAAAVITTFPETKNLTYEVIEVGETVKSAKAGE